MEGSSTGGNAVRDAPPTYEETVSISNPFVLIAPYLDARTLVVGSLICKDACHAFQAQLFTYPHQYFGVGHNSRMDSFLKFLYTLQYVSRPYLLSQVKALSLLGCQEGVYSIIRDDWLETMLSKLFDLVCLDISWAPYLHSQSMANIKSFHKLSVLLLRDCANLTSTSFRTLIPKLSWLTSLNVSFNHCVTRRDCLSVMSKMPYLRALALRSIGLKDKDLEIICEGLGSRLEYLDVSDNLLTDRSIGSLLEYCIPPPAYFEPEENVEVNNNINNNEDHGHDQSRSERLHDNMSRKLRVLNSTNDNEQTPPNNNNVGGSMAGLDIAAIFSDDNSGKRSTEIQEIREDPAPTDRPSESEHPEGIRGLRIAENNLTLPMIGRLLCRRSFDYLDIAGQKSKNPSGDDSKEKRDLYRALEKFGRPVRFLRVDYEFIFNVNPNPQEPTFDLLEKLTLANTPLVLSDLSLIGSLISFLNSRQRTGQLRNVNLELVDTSSDIGMYGIDYDEDLLTKEDEMQEFNAEEEIRRVQSLNKIKWDGTIDVNLVVQDGTDSIYQARQTDLDPDYQEFFRTDILSVAR